MPGISPAKERLQSAFARGRAVFDDYPDGIYLSDLVALLKQEGFSQSEASSATDHLIKRQAHMDYSTGYLTHIVR